MAITNFPKPTGSITNFSKVASFETWGTITTTWGSETRTWGDTQSLMDNISKPSINLTNSFSSFPTTALRNNFTGAVGFRFEVSSNIYVYSVGRLYVAGNTQDHKVNFWISTDTVTPIATATILASSTSDSNNYKYVDLSSLLQLSPGNTYYVAANNTSGGDTWKDLWSASSTINSPITNIQASYAASADAFPNFSGGANSMYETISLKFGLSAYDSQIINIAKPS